MSKRALPPVPAVPRRDVCMGRKPTLKRGGSSSIHRVHRHRPHPPPQRHRTHPKAAAHAHTSVELVRTTPEIAVGAASRPSILSEARSRGAKGPWRAGAPHVLRQLEIWTHVEYPQCVAGCALQLSFLRNELCTRRRYLLKSSLLVSFLRYVHIHNPLTNTF